MIVGAIGLFATVIVALFCIALTLVFVWVGLLLGVLLIALILKLIGLESASQFLMNQFFRIADR